MAQDIDFNKNEDFNKLKLSDLNKRLHKIYEGGGEKRIASHSCRITALFVIGLVSLLAHPVRAQVSGKEPTAPPVAIFPQANGSSVEVTANERNLINTPGPYTCAQDWSEITLLLTIDREGNVMHAMLFTSSNYSPPECANDAIANARALQFAPDPDARRKEWVFVTYRKTKNP